MKAHFIKLRNPFEFFPDPCAISNLFGPSKRNADNHFILKLQSILVEKYVDFATHVIQQKLDPYYPHHIKYLLLR